MSTVHKLDEQLISLIAAGEVVERPSSVVKELVENAIDAGAKGIEVSIDDGGKKRIEVIDDGEGMDQANLLLALQRHATSKLRSAKDLEQIGTLGFRGEALPSIAAVSRLRIDSRPAEQDEATRVLIEAGTISHIESVGAPKGTRVVVEDLFFRTPARKKFLKAAATETGRIHALLIDLAIAAPALRFRFISRGRSVFDLPSARDANGEKQRLGVLLGRELFAALYPFSGEEKGVQVEGFFAEPGHSRRDTRGYHLFLNGRVISDRRLMFAVRRAYRTLLEQGRHPVAVVKLTIPPDLVDVNVHPHKQEVRFHDERAVQDAVAHAIGDMAAKTPWVGSGRSYVLNPGQDPELRDRDSEIQDWHRQRVRQALGRFSQAADTAHTTTRPQDFYRHGPGHQGHNQGSAFYPENLDPKTTTTAAMTTALLAASAQAGDQQSELLAQGYFSRLKYLGQIFDTYLLCQASDRLVMVDQHAAHERITFMKLRQRESQNVQRGQRLLIPEQIELEPLLIAAALDHAHEIAALGFDLDHFGDETLLVRAIPAALARVKVAPLIKDLLSDLAEHGSQQAREEALDSVCSRIACHASIRAGRALQAQEVSALFAQLDQVDFGAHCPHGRPVARELSKNEIERLFERR